MIYVKHVSYNCDHSLNVELSNGVSGSFDLSPYLNKGIFRELKNIEYLKQAVPDAFGIRWPNGQDLSADTLNDAIK